MAQSQKKKGSRQSLLELEEALVDEIMFPIGLGCALDMFREKDEVLDMIMNLPEACAATSTSGVPTEILYEKYRTILDRYQEQPHLLDLHLERMIEMLLVHFRNCKFPEGLLLQQMSFKFLRLIFKVRGPKEVVKRMPHEISDLVPVLVYLENENLDDPSAWETGYVLVMWLSILIINPFNLKLLDGAVKSGPTIADRVMRVCKKCVVLNNNIGQAAPFLVARFLTRPDMQDVYLDSFIDWACKNMHQGVPFGTRVGAFAALSAIFKKAKREEILKFGEKVLAALLQSQYETCDTILRKAGTKLVQRIGMMFMKTKMAPWRYQRGSRSLLANLKGTSALSGNAITKDAENSEAQEDYSELNQYSGAIEAVLDKLILGLCDKDTVIRWSAAKGIGRVTNRLPKDYADEVVEGLLSKFSPREGNAVWHGACLALAELGRRGLLLPERLPRATAVIKKALLYDEIRGSFSIGAHVRDAACYVIWAFARAFEPEVMRPYVRDIATSLVITMLFDREVNCRRAASAAFQENVGRQGTFPHGIDIVTLADYFEIGVRTNSFTIISIKIAQYEEYTRPLIDHLVTMKFNHFDDQVRMLTATALANLAPLDIDYFNKEIVPKLIPKCMDADTFTSHGALICLGSIITRLKQMDRLEIPSDMMTRIGDICPTIIERKFGASAKGNDILRQGLNFFINQCCISKLPFHENEAFVRKCHELLAENVGSVVNETRNSAGDAMANFLMEYIHSNPARKKEIGDFLKSFCKNTTSTTMTARQGYCCSLGKLPTEIIKIDFPTIINSLLSCSKITSETCTWAESRRDAIYAIKSIFHKHRVVKDESWEEGIPMNMINVQEVYECLFNGMEDYTTDKRGDVGSWVRDASMLALRDVTKRLVACDPSLVDASCIAKLMGLISKQCCEKIDNVRVRAGLIFAELLHSESPVIDAIPRKKEVMKVFTKEFVDTVNWRSTALTYPKFVDLLPLEEYTNYLLEGLLISGGSLSDSVMKDANGAIVNYFIASGAMGNQEILRIGNILLQIFETNLKKERITVPLMKFLYLLLQSGTLLPILIDGSVEFGLKLVELVKSEILRSLRVEKLVIAIGLLCETLQGDPVIAKAALKKLAVFLCHQYPRVRLATSSKLYEALLAYGETMSEPEKVERVMSLISDTHWDAPVDSLKPIRNEICDILGIPQPSPLKQSL